MQQTLSGRVVTPPNAPVRPRDQEPPVLTRPPLIRQRPGSLYPAGRDGKLASRKDMSTPEPVRRTRRRVDFADFSPQFEASGQHSHRLVDPPDDLGGLGPGFQVLDSQRRGPVSGCVLLAGTNPPRRLVVLASDFKMAEVVVHGTSSPPILPGGGTG